jgi:hypothetical protein
MLECGTPIPVIQAFLGHESISSTMIYASITPELANQYLKNRDIQQGALVNVNDPTEEKISVRLPFLGGVKKHW